MQATSSPTSGGRSTGRNLIGLLAWGALAGALVTLAFVGRASGEADRDILYRYEFALGSVVVYGILVGLTVWIATTYGPVSQALGLRSFSWRWVWTALGLILLTLVLAAALEPILHGGREQGFAPEEWQPDRATAFLVNGLVAATVVPFAEELFFRGLGIRAVAVFGGAVAVLVTAVVFGLGHGVPEALPPLVVFGLALGWVRLRSGSVWPGIIGHGTYNGLGILIVYLQLAH